MVRKKRIQEVDDSASYLRSKKPLRATRGIELPDWPYRRILVVLMGLSIAVSSAYALNAYVSSSARFRVDPAVGNPQVAGLKLLDADEIRRIFADDLGLAMSAVDLEERRQQVEQLGWVRRASVGRVWPNKIAVYIEEREPVAFLRLPKNGGTRLIDSDGVILTPIEGKQFDLPVIKGIDAVMESGARQIRMNLFGRLMESLDSKQPRLSEFLSEVDISDPKNAVVSAIYKDEVVDLQMGDEHLRHRFEVFLKYIDTWKAEFGSVKSADLRFEDQVAVTPVKRR
jgi:hypothetical protein